jgi:Thioredoxin reductase
MSPQLTNVDVLVVGGGPAGIAAGARAAEQGVRVCVIDEGFGPGGQIWRPSLVSSAPSAAQRWRRRLTASGADVRSSSSVVDVQSRSAGGFVATIMCAGRPEQIEAQRLIIATGARERFLPFPGWTLPNVFGIGGAQALVKTGMSVRGRRVVIAGSGPLLLPVAASLRHAGATLVTVAEQASLASVTRFTASLWRRPQMLVQAALLRSAFMATRYQCGTWIVGASGDSSVRSVTVTDGRTTRELECDILCAAFGLVPNTELARLVGCSVADGKVVVDERQATSVEGIFCAGEPTGIGGVDLCLIEGEIAGAAATDAPVSGQLIAWRASFTRYARLLERAFALRPELMSLAKPDTIVCRCEDVRLCDLERAWTAREAKLYTRAGMGPCQGRICGAALESIMGWRNDSVRPPVQPTPLAAMLGDDQTR